MRKCVWARQFLNNAAPMQVETCRRMDKWGGVASDRCLIMP